MSWLLLSLCLQSGFREIDAAPRFQNLNTADGLSHNIVWAIAQDRAGFIWLGTDSGLNRYDGHEFKVYKHDPDGPSSLSDNQVRALLWDREDKLWVGTANGLNCFFREADRFVRFYSRQEDPKSLDYNYITALAQGRDGVVWAATHRGLNRIDPGTLAVTRFSDMEPALGAGLSAGVRALAVGEDGALWIGAADKGLIRYDPRTSAQARWDTNSAQGRRLSGNEIRALAIDRDGGVWIGTTEGLCHLDPARDRTRCFPARLGDPRSLPDDRIQSLALDAENRLWIGAKEGGLSMFDPRERRFRTFARRQELAGLQSQISGNDIISLFPDRAGMLWAGAYMAGLTKISIDPVGFSLLHLPGSDRPALARALHEGPAGGLWLGMPGEAVRWDRQRGRMKRFGLTDGEGGPRTAVQFVNWRGTVAALDDAGGVRLLDPSASAAKPLAAPVGQAPLQTLLVDADKRLWGVTDAGLAHYDPKAERWRANDIDPLFDHSVARHRVTKLIQDRNGLFWAASEGVGLWRIDPHGAQATGYFYDPGNPGGLSHNVVNDLCEDSEGRLWAATVIGLNLYLPEEDRFRSFGRADGLSAVTIHALAPDDQGGLWLSALQGVAYLKLGAAAPEIRNFDASNGLQRGPFHPAASLRESSGLVYFAGAYGINYFDPGHLERRARPSPVVLTSFRVLDRELDPLREAFWSGEIALHSWDNQFSFEYVALDYRAPGRTRYAYKLEGFNDEWVEVGDHRYGSYNDLPHGHYVLRVKAANSDGVWGEIGRGVAIHVLPPIWKTGWFRVGLLGFALVIGYGVHRARALLMERDNQRLQRLVDEKTEELSATRQRFQDLAHQLGIFEITYGVLDQIGKQLASLKALALQIKRRINSGALDRLRRARLRLAKRLGSSDPLGVEAAEAIAEDFLELERVCVAQRADLDRLAGEMVAQVGLMRDTIRVQHDYAKTGLYAQDVDLDSLIDDCLSLERSRLRALDVHVARDNEGRPRHPPARVHAPRIKLLHVLAHVVQNSLDALEAAPPGARRLEIRIRRDGDWIEILIGDNGVGFAPEMGAQAFAYGFTTKEGRLGFGLHASANAMRELGGDIALHSDGEGLGARAVIRLPLRGKPG